MSVAFFQIVELKMPYLGDILMIISTHDIDVRNLADKPDCSTDCSAQILSLHTLISKT